MLLRLSTMKNHYLLVQISDILRQLLENGSGALKELKLGIKKYLQKYSNLFDENT